MTRDDIEQERASLAELHEKILAYSAEVGVGHSVGTIILAMCGASSCIAQHADLPRETWLHLIAEVSEAVAKTWPQATANDR